MNVLIVGSGGREASIGWKINQSPLLDHLYFAPGNAGTSQYGENIPIKAHQIQELAEFAQANQIDLTLVGPEEPLVLGISDLFRQKGLAIWGPDSFCARLEGSKIVAKTFMKKYGIPTAKYQIFNRSEKENLYRYLETADYPLVLKADGLAAGKGVLIPSTKNEAIVAAQTFFEDNLFGEAGNQVVAEEFMSGEEATVFVLTDGENYHILPPAQDHKRIGDGDSGKNTGGMGAYVPAPACTPEILELVRKTIVEPTLTGLKSEGHPYRGVLYVGLMLTPDGPKVVEYNVRFGDPECQAVMLMLSSDLLPVLDEIAHGQLVSGLSFKSGYASVVVASAKGYPDKLTLGDPITLGALPESADQAVFLAGATENENGDLITSGGRVLGTAAFGKTLKDSLDSAYQMMSAIQFNGMHYRKDIGQRGLDALKKSEKV